MGTHLEQSMRNLIVQKHIEGENAGFIARSLRLPISTVVDIIERFKSTGSSLPANCGGDRRSKLSLEEKSMISRWVDERANITLHELKEKLSIQTGKIVSISTINRCLSTFKYSFKRIIFIPERRNEQDNIQKRVVYANEFNQLRVDYSDRQIFFLDELGFQVSMRSPYGRSVIGTAPFERVPTLKSKNFSVVAMMNRDGLIKFLINNRPFNSHSLCGYINNASEEIGMLNNENGVLIMDNASIHKTAEFTSACEEKRIIIKYLPAYSPFLNPIENLFSKWKSIVKSRLVQNEEELMVAINSASLEITSNDCDGYFRNMMCYVARCLNGEVIND